MKLMPMPARPAPAVMARSPNIGPNDGAARMNDRVVGSKVNVKPPADDPMGAVETSRPTRSEIASPMFDTPLPAPAAFVILMSTCRGERPVSAGVARAAGKPGSGAADANGYRTYGTIRRKNLNAPATARAPGGPFRVLLRGLLADIRRG